MGKLGLSRSRLEHLCRARPVLQYQRRSKQLFAEQPVDAALAVRRHRGGAGNGKDRRRTTTGARHRLVKPADLRLHQHFGLARAADSLLDRDSLIEGSMTAIDRCPFRAIVLASLMVGIVLASPSALAQRRVG